MKYNERQEVTMYLGDAELIVNFFTKTTESLAEISKSLEKLTEEVAQIREKIK